MTDAQLKVANNLIFTTLRVSVDAANTVLFVASAEGFRPHSLVSIDKEILAIESVVTAPNPALIVAAGGRGFDGTTAAQHSSGVKVQMLIDAWHHNALATEIQAIEGFLGPNGQNLTLFGRGVYNVQDYDFAPQSPGGSLIAGNNVITLTPVPKGVNGSNAKHYLWISGGSGAAEAVLITGGSAVAGAASGTVIVNCANAHSGAWTIASATGGAQETIYSIPGFIGTVLFGVDGIVTVLHATVSAPASGNLVFRGQGPAFVAVLRATDFTNGDMFSNQGGTCACQFENLGISQNGGFAQTGAGIALRDVVGAQYLRDVVVTNGEFGYKIIGCHSVYLTRVFYQMLDPSMTAAGGIEISGSGMVYITDCQFVTTPSTHLAYGMYLHSEPGAPVDGVWLTSTMFSGNQPVNLICNGAFLTNVQFNACQIDGSHQNGILLGGNGGFFSEIQFTGMHIHLQGLNGWPAAGSGVDVGYSSPSTIDNLEFTGGYIVGAMGPGVAIGRTGAKSLAFKGVAVRDNNRGNSPQYGGFYLAAGVTGLSIVGCDVYNEATGMGHQKCALTILGALQGTIVGNNFAGNEGAALAIPGGALLTCTMESNLGMGFLTGIGPDLASATTIVPTHGIHHVTGTAAIATIDPPPGITSPAAIHGVEAATVTLIPAGAFTWTAAGNIAIAGTATVDVPVTFLYDTAAAKWLKVD